MWCCVYQRDTNSQMNNVVESKDFEIIYLKWIQFISNAILNAQGSSHLLSEGGANAPPPLASQGGGGGGGIFMPRGALQKKLNYTFFVSPVHKMVYILTIAYTSNLFITYLSITYFTVFLCKWRQPAAGEFFVDCFNRYGI